MLPSVRTCTCASTEPNSGEPLLIMIGVLQESVAFVHAMRLIPPAVTLNFSNATYTSPAPTPALLARSSTTKLGKSRDGVKPPGGFGSRTTAGVASQQDIACAAVCVPLGHKVEFSRVAEEARNRPTAETLSVDPNLRSATKKASRCGSAAIATPPLPR